MSKYNDIFPYTTQYEYYDTLSKCSINELLELLNRNTYNPVKYHIERTPLTTDWLSAYKQETGQLKEWYLDSGYLWKIDE